MIDQQQYQVEKILAAKFCPKTNRVYYLVKWLNWDLTSSTWEPEQYLKNSIETLEEFKSNSKNNANPFNWKQYKEFTKFWREQDNQAKIPKNRGKKKKQPKQKIQKMNKKITKIKKFIKINSKEDESYEPQMQRQYTLSHQYRRCHSQKGSQKMSRRSEPIKTKRVKQEKIMLQTNQMIEKQKQKQKETMEKMLAKLPKNHILLVQTQKSQRKNEQSYQMCEQRQNIPQNLQKQEITQKITQKNSIQPKIQEKDNKYEVFSKKISELINNNSELISQVSNGIAKDVPSCKKNQQQEMQDQGRQMIQQGIKMNLKMKENQKQLQGQEADDEYSQISSNPRNLEAKNMRKTIIIYQNHQQSRPNRCKYKIIGIKRDSQNMTNVTNKEQLKYKVLNTETNEDYWQSKQFMLKNCAAQLIEFYQDNLDWKNKH